MKIVQKNIELLECLPEDIYKEYFADKNSVARDLEIDRHRWYETSVIVFKVLEGYIGCRYVSNVFSERMSPEDIGHYLKFEEYIPKSIITYVPKKEN